MGRRDYGLYQKLEIVGVVTDGGTSGILYYYSSRTYSVRPFGMLSSSTIL